IHSGNPCVNPADCIEAGHICLGELAPVQHDTSPDTNRYIVFSIPAPVSPARTSIQIKRTSLMHPSPPNLPADPPPNFSAFEGQFAYAGTPTKHCQNGGVPPCAVGTDAIY